MMAKLENFKILKIQWLILLINASKGKVNPFLKDCFTSLLQMHRWFTFRFSRETKSMQQQVGTVETSNTGRERNPPVRHLSLLISSNPVSSQHFSALRFDPKFKTISF